MQDRRNTLAVITTADEPLVVAKRGGKFQVQLDASHAMVLNDDAMVTD